MTFLSSIVYERNPFNISSKTRGSDKYKNGYLKLLSSDGLTYIPMSKTISNKELIDSYKVVLGKLISGHIGETDEEGKVKVLAKIDILNKNECCTDSYLCIGKFHNKYEAVNLMNYLKTSFSRFLLLQALSSMNISKEKFCFVPIQDFTKNSDINWSKSISDIDKQLYKKYKLTKQEIAFIEKTIKPMT